MSKHYLETGEIDKERLADEMYAERLKKKDWGELVGMYRDRLEKGSKTEKLQALRGLGSIVPLGSWQAFDVLLDYFEAEPPPEKIEDVHTREWRPEPAESKNQGMLADLLYGNRESPGTAICYPRMALMSALFHGIPVLHNFRIYQSRS